MEIIDFTRMLHDECCKLLEPLKFNKSIRVDGAVVCSYGTLIEMTSGCLALIRAGENTCVSIVFRSFLEAAADFINLNADETYIEHLMMKNDEEWIKVLDVKNQANPFLASIFADASIEERRAQFQQNVEKRNKQGIRSFNIKERFAKANLLDEYNSIYRFKSGSTHNSIGAMIDRHITPKGESFELVIYKERSAQHFLAELDSISGILLLATRSVHTRLKSTSLNRIDELDEELANIRSKYS